ncbi:hypothetical protein ANN_29117 [Periplaneta americana]|uniref:Uncharacterized protein n=1 Tax=Periplaneta americana TaxID=6978 RepID=A0ABQ8RU54_PERAM|nr:hypothetical protein ANN_29117 [Periplaneta americana]
MAWLYIGRPKKSTTLGTVAKYLERNDIQRNITCKELHNLGDKKAFKVGFPFNYIDETERSDFWLQGVIDDSAFQKITETKKLNSSRHINILLWNIKGLCNVMSLIPLESIAAYDAIILTEILTEEYNIQGHYGIYTFAQPTAGMSASGISIFLKPKLGKIRKIFKNR